MKAEELMIGDWVYNTHNDQPEQVYEIGSGLVMLAYNDLYEYDEIEPIPLTAELLMQNGFEKDPETGECLLSDYDDTFEVCWIGTILTVQSGYGRMELVNCQYVHELQHALRLCGIEKEIVFKKEWL